MVGGGYGLLQEQMEGRVIIPYTEVPSHKDYEPEWNHVTDRSVYNCSQQAIWNTALVLKPRYLLDIGTWEGTSAMLMAHYLDDYEPAGHVVTVDVQTQTAFHERTHPLITQVQAYPHTLAGLDEYPWARAGAFLPDYERGLTDSVALNTALILEALRAAGGELFDFVYIDGDHSGVGLLRDLEIVKQITRHPHYALLDDVWLTNREAASVYQNRLIHEYAHYDFTDAGWENFVESRGDVRGMPRMALVWEK